MEKIKTIEELAKLLKTYRSENKKIVHCHGVFDLLHIGHIRYFEQARRLGDFLIVTITPDRYVDKGPHRPAFTEALRAEAIASLKGELGSIQSDVTTLIASMNKSISEADAFIKTIES